MLLLDRLLIGLTAVAGVYFVKVFRAYLSFPLSNRGPLGIAAAMLFVAALLKMIVGYLLVGNEDWYVLACGGRYNARGRPDMKPEFNCSLGCVHDRAELGAAAAAHRALMPDRKAWITLCQILLVVSLVSWAGPLFDVGPWGQGVLIGSTLGIVLAFKSRSRGAKFLAGVTIVGLFLYFFGAYIDWEDWGELILLPIVLPFALMNQGDDD
ncbi:MAG: hypothetical protein HY925_05460 [Elusimicrobia bacterium]|nr:hypothetical protein [Elusimicrobiota bacterium]